MLDRQGGVLTEEQRELLAAVARGEIEVPE
jgi:hypothetical protein